jgi:tetratricopeptide (TPR) repeat protein
MMRWPALLLLLGLSLPAEARRRPPTPPPEPAGPTLEDRQAAFSEIDTLLGEGKQKPAADALVALTRDEELSDFHAEAYARLAGLLQEMGFPYAGLIAATNALRIDPEGVSSTVSLAVTLTDTAGDVEIIESLFAENVGMSVDDQTRGTIALMAARAAHRQGNNATAAAVLKLVPPTHPDFLDAKALEGVVLSLQGRHRDALAPLLTAWSMAKDQRADDDRLRNVLTLNIARAYFGAENFPTAIEYYMLVDRASPYWPEAQFERAWSHFRYQDMNGTLAQLHTLNSPFFETWYFPEADLLGIYSVFLMCKFPEASRRIDEFQAHYTPVFEDLQQVSARDAASLYEAMKAHTTGEQTDLPAFVIRRFENEDRFLDNLQAAARADAELRRIRGMTESPFAQTAADWLRDRRDGLIASEADRIKSYVTGKEAELGQMLSDSELSKLDILQMEARFFERASQTGVMPDARETARRDIRARRNQLYWPWEGEYWADEAGYYKINAAPECPEGLTPGG